MEFTLALLPFIAMTFMLFDVAWAVFVKSTLQYAVRTGVRNGITITGTQASAAHSNLTAMIKSIVQQNSLGILGGASGLSKIKVRYFLPALLPRIFGWNQRPDTSGTTIGAVAADIIEPSRDIPAIGVAP
jgi:hypothetical protein